LHQKVLAVNLYIFLLDRKGEAERQRDRQTDCLTYLMTSR